MPEITRLDQITLATDTEIDTGVMTDFAPILNYGVAATPTQKTGRLTTWARFLRLLRRAGLWNPEQLTAVASFALTDADSGRQIILDAATPQTITLSNLGRVRVFVANRGTVPWTLEGATNLFGGNVIKPLQSGWLEHSTGNTWDFDSADIVQENVTNLENNVQGGADASDNLLLNWADTFYQKLRLDVPIGTPLTYYPGYPEVVATANILWPDGSAGVYTLTGFNTDWEAETAWTLTHTLSGKTVTQSAITINSITGVETKPPATVS